MKPRAVAWIVQPTSGHSAVFLDRGRAEQQAVTLRGTLHDLFTHPPLNRPMIQKGLALADQAMLSVVFNECEKADEVGMAWEFPNSSVPPTQVREAVEWLKARGLVVHQDERGIMLAPRL